MAIVTHIIRLETNESLIGYNIQKTGVVPKILRKVLRPQINNVKYCNWSTKPCNTKSVLSISSQGKIKGALFLRPV